MVLVYRRPGGWRRVQSRLKRRGEGREAGEGWKRRPQVRIVRIMSGWGTAGCGCGCGGGGGGVGGGDWRGLQVLGESAVVWLVVKI